MYFYISDCDLFIFCHFKQVLIDISLKALKEKAPAVKVKVNKSNIGFKKKEENKANIGIKYVEDGGGVELFCHVRDLKVLH